MISEVWSGETHHAVLILRQSRVPSYGKHELKTIPVQSSIGPLEGKALRPKIWECRQCRWCAARRAGAGKLLTFYYHPSTDVGLLVIPQASRDNVWTLLSVALTRLGGLFYMFPSNFNHYAQVPRAFSIEVIYVHVQRGKGNLFSWQVQIGGEVIVVDVEEIGSRADWNQAAIGGEPIWIRSTSLTPSHFSSDGIRSALGSRFPACLSHVALMGIELLDERLEVLRPVLLLERSRGLLDDSLKARLGLVSSVLPTSEGFHHLLKFVRELSRELLAAFL
ncbi:hypothetical protein B0H13DRAFT_1852354 [Mycena leptocephala]|nr:hypothetical protein B0H13DRAFT_1852354 [Mycena leptocephala]